MAAPVGYSGTPLVRKLGIAEGSRVGLIAAPPGFAETLEPLPPGVRFVNRIRGSFHVIVCFVTARSRLERRIEHLAEVVFPAGSVWVAWPKRASRVATDMTEDVVREVCLPLGLVDNKVAAIDDTWSGLRMVWRRELRG